MFKKRGEKENFSSLLVAITTLIGTIIGAGILGIPYVVAKAGVLYGLLLIILFGCAFLFLNLALGEVVLRTKGLHQLPGYAEKYLGSVGKKIMMLTMPITIYGALTAYLIGEGEIGTTLLSFAPAWVWSLVLFVVASYVVARGIKTMSRIEFILIILFLVVTVVLAFFSFRSFDATHFTSINPLFLALPYGVILFSYLGAAAIPEIHEELKGKEYFLKKAIIIGSLVPIVVYLLFTVAIIGIVGVEEFELLEPNHRIATIALSVYATPALGVLANLLAILSMFTSFLTLGTALVQMYTQDLHLSKNLALILTLSIPAVLAFSGFTTFITILGLTGALAGGFEGILILLMHIKAKKIGVKKPEYTLKSYWYLTWTMVTMFLMGILHQIWVFVLS